MRALAVIPARGGSRRLPRKNVHPVLGRPMLEWVLGACVASKRFERIVVSTEDDEIARVARSAGADVLARPAELAGDEVFKQEVVVQAVRALMDRGHVPDVVASIQGNSPELAVADIERAFVHLERFGLWEVFTVNTDLCQNGALRLMRRDVVFQRTLSVHCGVIVTDLIDVHTLEDVKRVETRLARQRAAP